MQIQLEAAYKASQDGTGKGGTGPSLQEKHNKATRDQIRGAQRLGEELMREDLCDEDDISASQEHDTPGSPSPYDASVSQTTKKKLSLTLRAPKMKLLPSVLSSLNSRVKIFVFVANSRRHFLFLCKHIIWTLLDICRLPENSTLLHHLFLIDNEALSVVGNSYSVIPQNLMYKKATNKTRK